MKFMLLIALIFSEAIASDALKPFNDPTHVYAQEEVVTHFKEVILPTVQPLFEKYTQILFDPKFPAPIHPNKSIVDCWNCLYNQMVRALKRDKPEEIQINIIYMLLTHHKKTLEKEFPHEYSELQPYLKY
ncbi:MAG: hypothetical protein K0M45_07525 [Candidatus Paracaedibacteraceae bacterium]|nr:hypothetical protein [Candidatus Paracaedibacteraceae bacterium]